MMCEKHLAMLKEAIRMRGLSALEAESDEERVIRLRAMCQDMTIDNFEPFIGAQWILFKKTLELLNDFELDPTIMFFYDENFPNRSCPICLLNEIAEYHHTICETPPDEDCFWRQDFENFIERVADGALNTWKELCER